MKWITAEDIVNWVERRPKDAQQHLPRFIKRLIQSFGTDVGSIEMPDGEGTADHGWDGEVSFVGQSQFIPTGKSVWEIGTDRTVKKKADGDFEKRTKDPKGIIPSETTLVFVTPRKWEKKKDWVKEKSAQRVWHDVWALNARDLEDWFENAPAVAREFALHIGKYVGNVRGLEEFWREWSSATDPAITERLLLASHDGQATQLLTELEKTGFITTINAETVNEAIGFTFAALSLADPDRRNQLLSKMLLCENEDAARSAKLVSQELTVVLPANLAPLAGDLHNAGKSIIIADHVRTGTQPKGVVIDTPWRHDFEMALRAGGMPEETAIQVAAQTGVSISAYRRLLPVSSIAEPGAWNASEHSEVMVPAVLAGQWVHKDNVSDWVMLEKLALSRHDVSELRLKKLLDIEAAPIRNEGVVWFLSAPSDAFLAMGPHITSEHLEAFENVAIEVLSELDPRFELEAKDRFAAQIYGKSHRFSGRFRYGLSQALCLITTRLAKVGGEDGSGRVNWITGKILETVQANGWIGWASISDICPLLAEAAPTTYLNSIEMTLRDDPDTFVQLMTDEDGHSGLGACLHAGLLWSLETLAWFPEHFPRVANALASLVAIDPGGRWGNRPIGSLTDVFLPWKNHSTANVQKRLAVIDQIASKLPDVAWKLLGALGNQHYTTGTHRPKWRAITPLIETDEEYQGYWSGLRERYLKLGYFDPSRLAKFIGGRPQLSAEYRIAAIQHVLGYDLDSLSGEDRNLLRETVRDRLYHIRSFLEPDEIDEDEVAELDRANEFLSPEDPVLRNHWLFSSQSVHLPSGEKKDYREYDNKVKRERKSAAREILHTCDFEISFGLAVDTSLEGRFAYALGQIVEPPEEERYMDRLCAILDERYPVPLVNFSVGRSSVTGEEWVKPQMDRAQNGENGSKAVAALALPLPHNKATWDLVATYGEAANKQYWTWVSIWSTDGYTEYAVEKLLEVGRVLEAVDVAAVGKENVSTVTMMDVLKRTIMHLGARDTEVNRSLFSYHLEELFDCLDGRTDAEVSDIARLEFPFARLLEHSKRGMKAHDRLLAENPAYFAELISWGYHSDSGEEEAVDGLTEEQLQNRASNAHQVLHASRFVPGRTEADFDAEKCSEWFAQCREQLKERNRGRTGPYALVEVVRRTPVDDDDIWPVAGIRDAIEKLSNETFDSALHTAFYNSRGVTSRSMDEGGQQERALAARYTRWANVVDVEAPRIAAVLRSLADTYERQGKNEDVDARIRRVRG
jgi:hypothetical protein